MSKLNKDDYKEVLDIIRDMLSKSSTVGNLTDDPDFEVISSMLRRLANQYSQEYMLKLKNLL